MGFCIIVTLVEQWNKVIHPSKYYILTLNDAGFGEVFFSEK